MYVWHNSYPTARIDDVIFKRHECEWVLPLEVAKHMKYNPRHVPAIIYEVWCWQDIRGGYVHIIENMRSDYIYNRRVFASYKEQHHVWDSHPNSSNDSHSCTYLSSDCSG